MEELLLARWQFAITSTYHFLLVPLTLGLSILVAIMETKYVRTGDALYKKMAKFWGKLFLINFSLGVATGLVQEFQFGMNWSEYSRFMGDIFGVPLALEALTAFYLESVFIGLWIFGWERLSRKMHAVTIWVVAVGANISSLWILIANSFMQQPVGYILRNDRAELNDFTAVLTNSYVLNQYPHVLLAGLVTGGIFVMAISAYHLLRGSQVDFFRPSFKYGLICALAASLLVAGTGHRQAQFVAEAQPMKLAAMEALWETANPAPFALAAVIDQQKETNSAEIGIPNGLSFLVYNSFSGEVKGIKEIQAQNVERYGPGNYIPDVVPVFWSFRIMVVAGMWLLLITMISAYFLKKGRLESYPLVLKAVLWSLPVPYIANSTGWAVTEMGRQPWIVFGLQRVDQAVSPLVPASAIWTSLIGFSVVYGIIAAAGIYLFAKFARRGPEEKAPDASVTPVKGATLWN
ncbi:MAG: cydA 1 [Firmicutes bacterium]|nr:cydA 1 [Bacillota bacterium]